MEVVAAVMAGALLWLFGPGRKAWMTALRKPARVRASSVPLVPLVPMAAPLKRMPTPARPLRASRVSLQSIPVPATPSETVATAEAIERSDELPSIIDAVPQPLDHAHHMDRAHQPQVRENSRELRRPTPLPEPQAFLQLPITLGVALLLQAVAFTLLCVLGALGYVSLEIKGKGEAQLVERSLTREVAALEESLSGTRRNLDALQRMLANQAREAQQLHSGADTEPFKLTPEAKVTRPKALKLP